MKFESLENEEIEEIMVRSRLLIDCQEHVENNIVFKDIHGQNIALLTTEKGDINVKYL